MIGWLGVLAVAGCSGKTSSLLLERHAKGPLAETALVAQGVDWHLVPESQQKTEAQLEMTATHASPTYLQEFFNDRAIFGQYAGLNPYFPEHLVFYLKVANRGANPVHLSTQEIALVDDRGNQYTPISEDYITALAEERAPVATATRGMLEGASPGYFGFSLPIGKWFANKPQNRFALIKRASLQSGLLYPNVIHDGLVTFWNPSKEARTLQLFILASAEGQAERETDGPIQFLFTFQAMAQPVLKP
jgi:hypothetical protein